MPFSSFYRSFPLLEFQPLSKLQRPTTGNFQIRILTSFSENARTLLGFLSLLHQNLQAI
jgi:hypothetical protein